CSDRSVRRGGRRAAAECAGRAIADSTRRAPRDRAHGRSHLNRAGSPWKVDPGGAWLGDQLFVSFQRYPRPRAALDEPPRSWGATPCAVRQDGDLMVPLRDEEAVWLGLRAAADVAVHVAAAAQGPHQSVDAIG